VVNTQIQRFPRKDKDYRGQGCWGFQCHVNKDGGYRVYIAPPKEDDVPDEQGRTGEHGPAHVHAYNIVYNKESRFELIESDDHRYRVIPFNKASNETLTWEQMQEIIPVLEARAPELIQLWREVYKDEPVSGEVTRLTNGRLERAKEYPWVGKNDEKLQR